MAGLTALQVKNAKPGRHADGRGLYLVVRDTGSRSWVLRIQVAGVRQDFGLGAVDQVSLAEARATASIYKAKLRSGENVGEALAPAPKPKPTFAEAARACHLAIKDGWSNKRHSDSWLASLELHIFPSIGEQSVDEISSVKVRNALAPIWMKTPETARRCLQRIGTVLDYAHIEGWCEHEAALRSVTKGLPKQPPDDGHFEAMPYQDVPGFYAKLDTLPATPGRDALMFTILNAARSGETRLAVWPEFDLEKETWSVPPERMKMRKRHVVPLAAPSLQLLKRRSTFLSAESDLVFTNDGRRPLSDMTMTKILRDLGIAKITVHGFRSSFTDWAAERTKFPKEVVDKALAHKLVDRVEAAYRRTVFFERRRRLMADWARYVLGAARR